MRDKRIVKYNVDFCYKNFKYKQGAVSIDLSDVDNMKGVVEADWSLKYAQSHLKRMLSQATGIGGGWNLDFVTVEDSMFSSDKKYTFTIKSRLYVNLRRLYERPKT